MTHQMTAKEYLKVVHPAAPSVISIDIPIPPSGNALFVFASIGRVKTKAYRAWIKEAGWRVMAQHPKPIGGPYSLELQLSKTMRGDVDNRLKATCDLLVSLHITPDDRHAQRVTASRVAGLTEARILISEASA